MAEEKWIEAWRNLEQWRIQEWVEGIPHHIREIIRCEGGNDYQEGLGVVNKDCRKSKKRKANRLAKQKHISCVHLTAYNKFGNVSCNLPP